MLTFGDFMAAILMLHGNYGHKVFMYFIVFLDTKKI